MSRIRYSHRKEGPYIAMKAEAIIGGKEYTIKRMIHPDELARCRLGRFWVFRHEAKLLRAWVRRRIAAS